MQYTGLWPEAQQNQIADWLFSTDNDAQGQPKGIGLSVWRFNLGAGSAEQGDSAQIQPATRTECFLQPDGTYNWNKQHITTSIMVNESSDLRCLLGIHNTDWRRGNEIRTFFGKDSTNTYLGNTYGVENVVLAHSYWTNTPIPYMRKIREELRDSLKHYGVRYWQTELCIMGNDEEIGGGGHYDPSMLTALYVARVIHHDLVFGNAESWSWWRSMGGDYKDGLIRVLSADNWKTGKAIDSKLMWTLGNYSRFIRPGARRYDITVTNDHQEIVKDGDTEPYGVMASAYQNADRSWVVVAINYSEALRPFTLSLPGKTGKWTMYRTSDVNGENLKPVGQCTGTTQLEPKSVTTFVMK